MESARDDLCVVAIVAEDPSTLLRGQVDTDLPIVAARNKLECHALGVVGLAGTRRAIQDHLALALKHCLHVAGKRVKWW